MLPRCVCLVVFKTYSFSFLQRGILTPAFHGSLDAARAASTASILRLEAAGVKFRRPEDYYAEMCKTDKHMAKVKDKLIHDKKSIEQAENRRKVRDQKKFGKQVQHAKEAEKREKKKENAEAVKKWRTDKTKADSGSFELPNEDLSKGSEGRDRKRKAAEEAGEEKKKAKWTKDSKVRTFCPAATNLSFCSTFPPPIPRNLIFLAWLCCRILNSVSGRSRRRATGMARASMTSTTGAGKVAARAKAKAKAAAKAIAAKEARAKARERAVAGGRGKTRGAGGRAVSSFKNPALSRRRWSRRRLPWNT